MQNPVRVTTCLFFSLLTIYAPDMMAAAEGDQEVGWLAGDHHIHSRYSVGWDTEQTPPAPVRGGDAIYPIPMNALMARFHGLDWIVGTDHGGPNHSQVSLEWAYPEVLMSRRAVPEVIQFFGMELNTPGADHSSVIVPHGKRESKTLVDLESRFDKREVYPKDLLRDDPAKMLDALEYMNKLSEKPVVIANHPSRSAKGLGIYGLDDPAEFRDWNDTAPDVAVGMAGAPGHQALALNKSRFPAGGPRGGYSGFPTHGGFDQMTAIVGGFWDSMLGEGRRWWITANSDSHIHWTEGGVDFWPGEFSKTYVHARKNHDDILNSIRNGKIFVTTGDLISELYVTVSSNGQQAGIGEELVRKGNSQVMVEIRLKDPAGKNHHGDDPDVRRVDLILGDVLGRQGDRTLDKNPSTRVIKRFKRSKLKREGDYLVARYALDDLSADHYIRVRGTNTREQEPQPDPGTEDPWRDLWFYSNPVFISSPR